MLNLTASPGAIYRLPGGQTIPYWLYLRMLYLLFVSPSKAGTRSSMAFVLASLRAEGYETSYSVIAALVGEFRGLTDQVKALLRTIDPAQMRERYDDIVWNKTLYHMESVTPRATVNLAELSLTSQAPVPPKQKSTSVATLLKYAQEDRHESENAVGNDNAEKHDNFDLSRTSVPITEYNYQEYMYSTPQTPIAPLSVVDDSESPDYHLPATMWPRAPAYGTPHVDAFTGMELKTVHKPVYNPFTNQQYNRFGDGARPHPF
jgi:hypothetical protein